MLNWKLNPETFLHFCLTLIILCGAQTFARGLAFAADPFASNNGLYPSYADWSGSYRVSNYNYPTTTASEWLKQAPRAKLTVANAAQYVEALKQFVEPTLEEMIDNPDTWDLGPPESWLV
jgi:hypothetical protein